MAANGTPSRLNTTTNLALGGTYDILLISTPQGYPTGQIFFLLEPSPRKITGVQKVAQLFIKILFSQRGSDVLYPNLGTDFPSLVIGANITNTQPEFMALLTTAINDARDQVKYIFSGANDDPSSKLDKIILQDIQVVKDSVSMFVQLVTVSGEQAIIAIPFPQLDLPISDN